MKFGESTRLRNFSSLSLSRGAAATRHVLKKEKLRPFAEGCLINACTKGGARNKWLICSRSIASRKSPNPGIEANNVDVMPKYGHKCSSVRRPYMWDIGMTPSALY